MVAVSFKVKSFFFDRLKVIAAVEKDRLKFLRNAGGFARKTARTSMKRKGKARARPKNLTGKAFTRWQQEIENQPASPPGTPPFAHSDDAVRTLKNILFAYDISSGGVVVGPVGLRHKKLRAMGGTIPPSLHEYGGTTRVLEKRVGRRWAPLGGRARPGQPVRKRNATYPARPYMKPAVEKTKARFKNLWFTSAGALGATG
jgi:hypothetical protein